VSAYKDPISSQFAIVAINPGGLVITQAFNLANFKGLSTVTPWITSASFSLASQPIATVSGSSFSYELPAMSVVTLVGQSSNTAPSLAQVTDRIVHAGVTLLVTNTATDPDAPPQTLAFSFVQAPANASLNSSNGVFSWRPSVTQANTTNTVVVRVSDNGSPSLATTNSFNVTVLPLNPPAFASFSVGGGFLNLNVTGDSGPDYTLLTSTNLSNWQPVLTTNPPTLPMTLTISNGVDPQRFFRIRLGP
jgi:Flp pilus assembly protein TadG